MEAQKPKIALYVQRSFGEKLTAAQKMCKVVRDVVAAYFGQEVADKVRVQYGGSVKP